MSEWLAGKKTYIVFGLFLINEVAKMLGVSGVELPASFMEYAVVILSVIGLVLRKVTKGEAAF